MNPLLFAYGPKKEKDRIHFVMSLQYTGSFSVEQIKTTVDNSKTHRKEHKSLHLQYLF